MKILETEMYIVAAISDNMWGHLIPAYFVVGTFWLYVLYLLLKLESSAISVLSLVKKC